MKRPYYKTLESAPTSTVQSPRCPKFPKSIHGTFLWYSVALTLGSPHFGVLQILNPLNPQGPTLHFKTILGALNPKP